MVLLKVPPGRYVDDFFRADREGVALARSRCLTVIAALLGLPADDEKDADHVIKMVLLGATAIVDAPSNSFLTQVAEENTTKCKEIMLRLLGSATCSPVDAASIAGRLSFSVTLAANRVGRAFIKPFNAQLFSPMHGNVICDRLAWSIQ